FSKSVLSFVEGIYDVSARQLSEGSKEVSRECPFTNFNGSLSSADVMRMDSESQKLKSIDAADVFQAYFALCSWGIGRYRLVNVRQTTTVSSSNFIHNNDFRNTSPSTPRGGINTRVNPEVSLTTGEATCSRGIGGRPSVNVRQTTTVSSSNFIHNNGNTGPFIPRVGRNTRANPEVSLTTAEATCSSGISRHRSVRRRPTIRDAAVGSSSVAGTGLPLDRMVMLAFERGS
ncbi:hypothetical protein Tco_1333259, partial [Tanacetum coccineum]